MDSPVDQSLVVNVGGIKESALATKQNFNEEEEGKMRFHVLEGKRDYPWRMAKVHPTFSSPVFIAHLKRKCARDEIVETKSCQKKRRLMTVSGYLYR